MNQKEDLKETPLQNKASSNKWKQMKESNQDKTSQVESESLASTSGEETEEVHLDSTMNAQDGIKLAEENKTLQKQLEELQTMLQYSRAELQNNARRHHEELKRTRSYATADAVNAFIDSGLLDSVEAAKEQIDQLQEDHNILKQMKEGNQNILDMIHVTFKKLGVTEINSAAGEVFDPHVHSAVATETSENAAQQSDVIVKELRKGYRLHERVLRPALVVVSQAKV